LTVKGYTLIDGANWRVSLEEHKTRRALPRRRGSYDGIHLQDVQAFLEQPGHCWLVDPLRFGTRIYLPQTATV
jgi:hypothetical protein